MVNLYAVGMLVLKGQTVGVPACLSMTCHVLQALEYLLPELPSTISFDNDQRMHVTAKNRGSSSKLDSSSTLHS